jgi:IPT/TIG domain
VGRSWFDHVPHLFDTVAPGGNTPQSGVSWDDYLILLGGPFAALALARATVTTKTDAGTLQKTVATDGTPSLRQALTGDDGNTDLVDTQYLLFNLVALAYVIIGFIYTSRGDHPGLPDIPGLLLSLTSVSAATYVLNKTIQNNAPVITSVTPLSARPGDRITIAGSNFIPDGTTVAPTVTIGGRQALVEAAATNTTVTAYVPLGLVPPVADLVMTTAAHISTAATPLSILADKPQIIGVSPPRPPAGATVTITGSGFTSPASDSKQVTVLASNQAPAQSTVALDASGLETVTYAIPATLASGSTLALQVQGTRPTPSDQFNVTIA